MQQVTEIRPPSSIHPNGLLLKTEVVEQSFSRSAAELDSTVLSVPASATSIITLPLTVNQSESRVINKLANKQTKRVG
jgi:hypothetical protein